MLKTLTDKFRAYDTNGTGMVNVNYEQVLPPTVLIPKMLFYKKLLKQCYQIL